MFNVLKNIYQKQLTAKTVTRDKELNILNYIINYVYLICN